MTANRSSDGRDPTRRDVVVGTAAAAAFGLSAGTASAASSGTTLNGLVYEDKDGASERHGLADVLVSNGRDVVKTGSDGRYTLPIDGDCIVFVIKPVGFSLPLDENNLPRFYYIHQPAGSPAELNLRYRGLAPTGPLPASIDFGLRRAAEPSRFDVLLFTDPQPESLAELGFVRDTAVTRAFGLPVAFGMTLGDIMFDDLSFYDRSNRAIGRIGVPWHHLPGNHDLNFEAPDATASRETYKRVFGPPGYAFYHGDSLFILLDNVKYLGPDPKEPRASGKYVGEIGARQLAFVEAVLAQTPPDRLVVVALHIPLRTYWGDMASVQTADADALLKLLGTRPAVSFAGHTHTTEHHYLGPAVENVTTGGHHHHVLTAVSGSWWSGPLDKRGIAVADSSDGTPHGFHILSIDGNRYTTRYIAASEPADTVMRIMLDSQFHQNGAEIARDYTPAVTHAPVPRDSVAATEVVVNVFDGGPRSRIRLRVGDRLPVEMTPSRRPDPFVAGLYARNAGLIKPWVKAAPCSHIWTARLPADLRPGTYKLAVEGENEYGQKIESAMVLEVAG
jgi:hypothetical protein